MAEQTAQEPTMEEILASIRRIISEDDAPAAGPAAANAEPADDVLELTERVDAPEPAPTPAPPPPRPAPIETSGDLDIFPSAPAPKPYTPPEPRPMPAHDDDALISQPIAASVASAFGQLSRTTAMPAAGRTLEDLVREMLRPMLREWMDENLEQIVGARVQAEVERLSRGG